MGDASFGSRRRSPPPSKDQTDNPRQTTAATAETTPQAAPFSRPSSFVRAPFDCRRFA
uniref:Uncharacterized protein n=1 Tax=Plectus sambesii TaxID=2011161 RepID=A0A914WBI7_9BILA